MKPNAVVLAVCAIAVSLVSTGCSEIHYIGGHKPDVSALEEVLVLGQSTSEDVRAAIGIPVGEGVIMTPIDLEPRKVWSYYYEVGNIKGAYTGNVDWETRRIFLFVYFDDARYDGYMWFSSLPEGDRRP